MGKEKIIPIIALVMLLIGASSSAYVYATKVYPNADVDNNADSIIINDQQYAFEEIFSAVEPRTFESLNFSGIALDNMILVANIDCPSCHEYTITGDDGYQKTVTWENMQNGLLTLDKMTVFSDLPKAFRIKNVVEIEVI